SLSSMSQHQVAAIVSLPGAHGRTRGGLMATSGWTRRRRGFALLAALLLSVIAGGTSVAAAPRDLAWPRVAPPAMAGAILRDMTSNSGVLLAVGSAPPLDAGIWRSGD